MSQSKHAVYDSSLEVEQHVTVQTSDFHNWCTCSVTNDNSTLNLTHTYSSDVSHSDSSKPNYCSSIALECGEHFSSIACNNNSTIVSSCSVTLTRNSGAALTSNNNVSLTCDSSVALASNTATNRSNVHQPLLVYILH